MDHLMTAVAALTAAEADLLAECEATIERGIKTFREVGEALISVRDNRLYRAEFSNFEDYCRDRWGFSRQRALQLIDASEVVTTIVVSGLPAPANEGQARELARVPEEQRADVWRETLERTEGKPTASAIRDTYTASQPQPEPVAEPEPAPVLEDDPRLMRRLSQVMVEKAMDEFLPPDPESPHRGWRINFLAAMAPAYRLMSGFAVDSVAEHADEECLDELERLAAQVASYRDRVRAARPVPNNLRHLRAVS